VPSLPPARTDGLAALRRSGAVTELLFLYECATEEPTQLRPIAERLGLTVQAASHSFRRLLADGLVEVRSGRYRPTVRGVATLHAALDRVGTDVAARLARLHVIRSTRALAAEALPDGAPVRLEMVDGVLTAHGGTSGPSRGRVARGGPAGSLIEVVALEGIVPIAPGRVTVVPLSAADLADPGLSRRLARIWRADRTAIAAAEGIEAWHAARASGTPGVLRFGVAASCRAASRVGVPSVVAVAHDALPDLLAEFSDPDPPPLEVRPLSRRERPRGSRH